MDYSLYIGVRPPVFKDQPVFKDLPIKTALSRSQKCDSHCNSPVLRDHLSCETTFFGPLRGLLRQV